MIIDNWNNRQSDGWNNRPWILPSKSPQNDNPIYIAVGGVTGAGKSTIVREVASILEQQTACMQIDERETHHPFLDRLFFNPKQYSFQIQLNFMIQRCILVKRWLEAGFSLIMERSHCEDPVFVQFLLRHELITPEQFYAYMGVSKELDKVTPLPDILVMLDVEPQEAIRRIDAAELSGQRPKEFPDDDTRERWVTSWSEIYKLHMKTLQANPSLQGRLHIRINDRDPGQIAIDVIQCLRKKGKLK